MATRRSKGDGSGYKRKDGRWVGNYQAEMPTGETKTKYVYAKTRKDAAARLRAALAERESGLVTDDLALTVGKYLDQWLASARDTAKDRTWDRMEEVVRLHLKPQLGEVRLGKPDAMRVQRLDRAKRAQARTLLETVSGEPLDGGHGRPGRAVACVGLARHQQAGRSRDGRRARGEDET